MGLLTQPTASEQTLQLLRDSVAGSYNQLRAAFNNACQLVWENPYKMTPAEVLAALGTDAAALFAYSNAVVGLLNTAAAETGEPVITAVVPDGVTYTLNADGTVTLG